MKIHKPRAHKIKRASISTALTVGVIAVVLLINVLYSAFAASGLWFVDLTTYTRQLSNNRTEDYELYTLTPGAVNMLSDTIGELNAARAEKGEEAVKVEIIFCDDPDNLMSNTYRRLIYMTALCLQKEFPDAIEVKTVNIKRDPSQVQAYKTTSYTKFYSTSVIVASGTEYRHLSTKSFFMEDTTTNELWAYSGERRFLATIFEVTKAASPKAVLLTNHGESGYSKTFLALLEDAGYEVVENFDLEKNDLPEDCRLIVCVDPRTDFKGYSDIVEGTATVSEIQKLEAFLDNENSMMVFFNADTPHLPTFEEYMEKWGISILRTTPDEAGDRYNYLIKDETTSLSPDGYSPVGVYATSGTGSSITSDMQAGSIPPKVVFKNSTAFKFSPRYQTVYVQADPESGTQSYSYAGFYSSGIGRQAFDMFRVSENAVALAGGHEILRGEREDPYMLMTIASETIITAGDRNGYTTVNHDSYVIACASSEFLSDEILTSGAYGNADLLASTLRTLGKDSMAALIDQYLKPFVDTEVQSGLIKDTQKNAYTVVLAVLPAVILFGSGIVVVTKRKYS